MKTLPDDKQKQDSAYDPAQEYYDREFNDITRHLKAEEDAAAQSGNETRNPESTAQDSEAIRHNEESGGWQTNVSGRQPRQQLSFKARLKSNAKKLIPTGVLLSLLTGGAIGLGNLGLFPFAPVEAIINDMHDAYKSQHRKQIDLGGSTVDGSRQDREKACQKPSSVACRRVSLTTDTAKEFEDKKFKLNNKTEIGGRVIFSSFTFPDGANIDSKAAFDRHMKTSSIALKAFSSVIDLDTSFFNRGNFFSDFLHKRGLSKAKQIVGDSKDEVDKSYKDATSPDKKDVSLQPDKSAESGTDEEKRAAQEANQSSNDIAKQLNDAAATGQRVPKFAISLKNGAISVAQFACALYNTATVTANLARAELVLRIAKFAMAVASGVHAMKAGDSTNVESAKLLEIFSPSSVPSKIFDPDKNEMVANPYIGLNISDAAPIKIITLGSKEKLDPIAMRYVRGNATVGFISKAVAWMNTNIGKKNIRIGCKIVNNPVSGIIGFVSAPILGLGLELLTSVLPIEELAASLINTLIDTIAGVDITTEMVGPLAGYGMVFGLAEVMGGSASSFGLVPGDLPDVRANMAANNQLLEQRKALAIDNASKTPFNITNQYTFLGSLAASLGRVVPPVQLGTLSSSFGKLLALPSASFGMLAHNANATYNMPVSYYGDERFSQCDDPDIQEELKVRADMGCHIRRVPRPEAPSAEVFSYMKRTNQVDENDNAVPGSYYAYFKEYCTEARKDLLGKTSVPVEEQEEAKIGWYTGAKCSPANLSGVELEHNRMSSEHIGYLKSMDIRDNTQTRAGTTTPTEPGDAAGLAKAVANHPNIQFVNPHATKVQLEKFAAGGEVFNECGNRMTVSKYLLSALLTNAPKYKILINNIGFREDRSGTDDCGKPERQHPLGTAVDLNNIEIIGGANANGLQLPQDAVIANQYATDFLAALPLNRGGVGQSDHGMNPTFPPGSIALNGSHLFPDAGNHLHIDARNRENLRDTT